MRRSRREIADEWIFASKSNGRHPRQVDDLGARGRGVLRRHSRSRVATANVSAVACDRGRPRDRGRARIFLMSFVADAASAFETQSANILHGCYAVSYFLALQKHVRTIDRREKAVLSSHRKCFQPPFRSRGRAVSRTFELRAKKRRTRVELAQV